MISVTLLSPASPLVDVSSGWQLGQKLHSETAACVLRAFCLLDQSNILLIHLIVMLRCTLSLRRSYLSHLGRSMKLLPWPQGLGRGIHETNFVRGLSVITAGQLRKQDVATV